MKEVAHKALKAYIVHFPITRGTGRLMSLLWRPLSSGRYVRETVLQPWPLDTNQHTATPGVRCWGWGRRGPLIYCGATVSLSAVRYLV